uniref:thymidine kinase n=1 Tax=viral metagenome TaxID=1070528 RepID=A0A6C0DRP7_9ZZZZ
MRLELIIGPMFAGKSSALQSIVRRRQAIGWSVLVVKHTADTRYVDPEAANAVVVNHDKQSCAAVARSDLMGLLSSVEFAEARLIIVEEGQFFADIVEFALAAVEEAGKDLVVVGLDGDAHRRPFGRLLELIPLADEVQRLYAFCKLCGDGTPARFTSATTSAMATATLDGGANVGGADSYQPVCRRHFLSEGGVL